jgi:hypothetical protein
MPVKKKSLQVYLLLGALVVGIAAVAVILLLNNRSCNSSSDSPQPEKPNDAPPVPPSNNDKYAALTPTKNEREYQKGENISLLPISSVGIFSDGYFEYTDGQLPTGAAILTDTLDGSGNGASQLNSKGITHIIHACPKPRSSFSNNQDFINCVVKAVQNSIILADREKFEKLAIPFVGGGTYLGSCDPQKLARG